MTSIKRAALFALLYLTLITTGCSIRENVPQSEPTHPQTTVISKNLSFYYGFTGEVPLTNDTKALLNDFGKPISFWPAEPEAEIFTEIPQVENNAKGADPITIVLPDLEFSKYSGPYITNDYKDGLEISTYYRVVSDMITDECVKIYIDSEGSVIQYETVNLGKYDALNLNEEALADRILRLQDAIHNTLPSVTLDFFVRDVTPAPYAYALFTDNEDRLVIKTTTALTSECSLNNANILVDLYAAIE